MNNSESKKRLLALQKSKFLSAEIQDALRFAIEKLSDGEYQDSQIPKLVMANKRWSQAEENQLIESLLAGNSIELIAANLSLSTNSVFSKLHLLGVISINSSKAIDIKYRDVGSKEKNIEIDLNRKCIECAKLLGPKRLKRIQTSIAVSRANCSLRQVEKVYRVFAVTSVKSSDGKIKTRLRHNRQHECSQFNEI